MMPYGWQVGEVLDLLGAGYLGKAGCRSSWTGDFCREVSDIYWVAVKEFNSNYHIMDS